MNAGARRAPRSIFKTRSFADLVEPVELLIGHVQHHVARVIVVRVLVHVLCIIALGIVNWRLLCSQRSKGKRTA